MMIFLGSKKDENYQQLVKELLQKFHDLGCSMYLKIHFLHSHLEFLPKNCRAVGDGQGKRFHHDTAAMGRRYQGRWNESTLPDNYWIVIREYSGFFRNTRGNPKGNVHRK
ncbi:uncharacterized protein TNCV_1133231 [Trichonephila clavipes]|nr:uncharacterized protein TNCV_1133231 [Trichonephila clavipes]